MRILVDCELRHEVKGDYRNLSAGVAFGASRSKIDIKYMTIDHT